MADAPGERRRLTRASSRSSAAGSGSIDDMNLGTIPGASGFGTFDRTFSQPLDWEAAPSFPLNSSWNSMSRGPSFGSDGGGDLPTTNSFMLSPNPSFGAMDRNGSACSSFAIPSSPFASSPDFLAPSMSKVPLEGFGSFSTARSRRAGGARQVDKGRLQPDIVKHEVEPLLLQEAVRRGSSSPEDKLLSPPLAPSPPPLLHLSAADDRQGQLNHRLLLLPLRPPLRCKRWSAMVQLAPPLSDSEILRRKRRAI